jgi:hypothetical protein
MATRWHALYRRWFRRLASRLDERYSMHAAQRIAAKMDVGYGRTVRTLLFLTLI